MTQSSGARTKTTAVAAAAFTSLAALLSACGDGKDGAGGTPGAQGAPGGAGANKTGELPGTVTHVEPRVGLLGRKLQVTIALDGQRVPERATAKFGDGINVTKVTPAGLSVVCDVEIGEEARLGPRDLEITGPGMNPRLAKAAFVVAAPLDLKVTGGKAEQGGLVRVDVANRDRVWFDPENFTLFPDANEGDAALFAFSKIGFTATDGSIVLIGDPLAKTGPLGFLGVNDPSDAKTPTFLTARDAVSVSPRAPETLTAGKPLEKTLADPLETAFFQAAFTPEANEGLLVDVRANKPEGSTMNPLVLAYPESGRIVDLLDEKQDDPGFPAFGIPATEARVAFPVTSATKGFFVVVDSALAAGPTATVSMDYRTYRAAFVAEQAGAHDEKPQALGDLPEPAAEVAGRIVRGELTVASEIDVYEVGAGGDVQVSVTTDAEVNVLVDHVPTFDSDAILSLALGGKAGSATTANLPGKSRFIMVLSAEGAQKPTGTYSLGIRRVAGN